MGLLLRAVNTLRGAAELTIRKPLAVMRILYTTPKARLWAPTHRAAPPVWATSGGRMASLSSWRKAFRRWLRTTWRASFGGLTSERHPIAARQRSPGRRKPSGRLYRALFPLDGR